jgi:hypothetical protein
MRSPLAMRISDVMPASPAPTGIGSEAVERTFHTALGGEPRWVEAARPHDFTDRVPLHEIDKHLLGVALHDDESAPRAIERSGESLKALRKPPALRAAERPLSLVRVTRDEHGQKRLARGSAERGRIVVEAKVAANPPDASQGHCPPPRSTILPSSIRSASSRFG